ELLRPQTAASGILLVADEVITFRLATGGLHTEYGLEPDLVVLGKLIGGGLPVGAYGGRAEVMAVTDPREPDAVQLGGTFTGNPGTMRAGAGALGLCTAFHLTELGVESVTVIERGQIAGESSGLSVGIIETQYLEPLAIEIRARSMDFFRRLEREHGLEITRNGYLRLGRSTEDLAAFERSVSIQHDLGVDDARVLDQDGLRATVPDLECSDLAGGLFG